METTSGVEVANGSFNAVKGSHTTSNALGTSTGTTTSRPAYLCPIPVQNVSSIPLRTDSPRVQSQ